MSLYKFFESYVEESPELISVRAAKSQHYDNLYHFFLNKNRKSPIDSFLDLLFYDSFLKSSDNLRKYELLKLKSRRIGQVAQGLFDSQNVNKI